MSNLLQACNAWLQTCPLLEGQRLNTNYLGPEPVEYTLIETPAAPVLATYLDGSTLRQKALTLSAIRDYSPDLLAQLAESGFWGEVAEWVSRQDALGQLPDLGEGRTAESVAVTASPYLFANTAQTARYQLQLLLTYCQEPYTEE